MTNTTQQTAMLATIQAAGAADPLDKATKRLAGLLDTSDTDDGLERVQTDLNAAILDAIITVAYEHGWAQMTVIMPNAS